MSKKKIKIDQDLYDTFNAWRKDDENEELYAMLYQKMVDKVGEDRLEHCKLIVEMAGK